MNETKLEYELRYTKGMNFIVNLGEQHKAFKMAAKWLKNNPEVIVTGTGQHYDFDEGNFSLHLFTEK